jgi:hypothetical protein
MFEVRCGVANCDSLLGIVDRCARRAFGEVLADNACAAHGRGAWRVIRAGVEAVSVAPAPECIENKPMRGGRDEGV